MNTICISSPSNLVNVRTSRLGGKSLSTLCSLSPTVTPSYIQTRRQKKAARRDERGKTESLELLLMLVAQISWHTYASHSAINRRMKGFHQNMESVFAAVTSWTMELCVGFAHFCQSTVFINTQLFRVIHFENDSVDGCQRQPRMMRYPWDAEKQQMLKKESRRVSVKRGEQNSFMAINTA